MTTPCEGLFLSNTHRRLTQDTMKQKHKWKTDTFNWIEDKLKEILDVIQA